MSVRGNIFARTFFRRIAAARFVVMVAISFCIPARALAQSTQPGPSGGHAAGSFVPPRGEGWRFVGGQWVRPSGACAWSDLIKLGWRDGDLVATPCPGENARAMLRGGRSNVLIELRPGGELILAARVEWGFGPRIAARPQLRRLKFGEFNLQFSIVEDRVAGPDRDRAPLHLTSVGAEPGLLSVTGLGKVEEAAVEVKLEITESAGANVSVTDRGDAQSPVNLTVHVDHLIDLPSKHERETREYLSPLLRPLAGGADVFGPGAADVYKSFEAIEPSPAARRAFESLLPNLGADDPADREAAAKALREEAAADVQIVCAAARRARAGEMSPQQRALVESFLRDQSRHPEPDAARRRGNELFLIDCLEFDDPRVRAAASEELARLLGRPIGIDPASAPQCGAAAEALRRAYFSRRPR